MKCRTCFRFVAALGLLAGSAWGQELLWDNGVGQDCGTGMGGERNTIITDATSLDDFLIPEPGGIVTGVHAWILIREPLEVYRGTDLLFYPTSASGKPPCTSPLVEWLDLPFDCVFSGRTYFGFRLFIVRLDPIIYRFDPGHYFLAVRVVDNGRGRAFWKHSLCDENIKLNESYFDSRYFGVNCLPGRTQKGFPVDYEFQILGFIFGQPDGGLVRDIQPVFYSGAPDGGPDEVRSSDDRYYQLTAAAGFSFTRFHFASVEFQTTLPKWPIRRLDVLAETGTDRTFVAQTVSLYDYHADEWVLLDERPLPAGPDQVVTIENIPQPDRFLSDISGRARLRIDSYSPGLSLAPFQHRTDELKLVVTYELP